jgi:hypothetical protein
MIDPTIQDFQERALLHAAFKHFVHETAKVNDNLDQLNDHMDSLVTHLEGCNARLESIEEHLEGLKTPRTAAAVVAEYAVVAFGLYLAASAYGFKIPW